MRRILIAAILAVMVVGAALFSIFVPVIRVSYTEECSSLLLTIARRANATDSLTYYLINWGAVIFEGSWYQFTGESPYRLTCGYVF